MAISSSPGAAQSLHPDPAPSPSLETGRPPGAGRPRRLVGVEGLRGLAALTVLAGHVHLHLTPDAGLGPATGLLAYLGQGLTLFFVLSGFLLYGPFVRAVLDRRHAPSTWQFLLNRALRIYPAYLVVLLLVSLPLGLAYTRSADPSAGVSGTGDTVGRITDLPLLAANASLLHTLMPWSLKTGLGVSWSLTTELCFYLVLPLLGLVAVAAARRLRPSAAVLVPVVAMLAAGTVGRWVSDRLTTGSTPQEDFFLSWGATWQAVFARSLIPHADLFGWGMAAAVVVTWAGRRTWSASGARALRGALLAGLVAVPVLELSGVPREAAVAVGCAALLGLTSTAVNGSGPGPVARLLDAAPLRWLGLISYSVYLWHVPVLWAVKQRLDLPQTPQGFVTAVALVLALVLPLATATYLLVERPALRLKRSQAQPATTRSTAGVRAR